MGADKGACTTSGVGGNMTLSSCRGWPWQEQCPIAVRAPPARSLRDASPETPRREARAHSPNTPFSCLWMMSGRVVPIPTGWQDGPTPLSHLSPSCGMPVCPLSSFRVPCTLSRTARTDAWCAGCAGASARTWLRGVAPSSSVWQPMSARVLLRPSPVPHSLPGRFCGGGASGTACVSSPSARPPNRKTLADQKLTGCCFFSAMPRAYTALAALMAKVMSSPLWRRSRYSSGTSVNGKPG
mmetsp:Transcript_15646/g.51101  ORF Transcript_15646/g.51101 Transcript_15646/m.51101 type:complete len:240 (+) Transcript_15646:281-1000(+)